MVDGRFRRVEYYGGVEIDHYTIRCHPTLVQKEKTRVGEDDMYVSVSECVPGCW